MALFSFAGRLGLRVARGARDFMGGNVGPGGKREKWRSPLVPGGG